jgi:hypothetical protein
MTKITAQPKTRAYVPKPPSQRAYAPKASDPGQRITWTGSVGNGSTQERSGIIWSVGALPPSVWAQPDDMPSGDMALVMLRNMSEHPSYPVSWQRDTIKRCGHLAASKGMFAEYVTRTRYEYGKGNVEYRDTVAYHCDRDCAEVKHETRDCRDWEPSIGSTIKMLLNATARGRSDLCRRCVYLTEPAEVTAVA